jgi:protein phosphatase
MNEPENTAKQSEEGSSAAPIRVHVFGRTDVGLVREHNEDNFLVADLSTNNRSIKPEVREHDVGPRGTLFIVCDGMGGAAAGEVASQIGVDTIYEVMQAAEPQASDEDLARLLASAVREAGVRIFTAARLNRRQRGMGTTVTVAVLNGQRLLFGQVGDSRAYVIRGGAISQVTKDQSLVQQLIDAKQITEEEARNFDRSNIILQALGTMEDVHVDITSALLRRGDTLVMCSDGLSGLVSPGEILKTVSENEDPVEACRVLIEKARAGGGHDNITVIVARFDGEGLPPLGEEETLSYKKFEYAKSGDQLADTLSLEHHEDSSIRPIFESVELDQNEQLAGPPPPPPPPKNSLATPSPAPPVKVQSWRVLVAGALAGLLAGGAYVGYAFYKNQSISNPGLFYRHKTQNSGPQPKEDLQANTSMEPDLPTEASDVSTNSVPFPSENDSAGAREVSSKGGLDELPGLAPTPESEIVSPVQDGGAKLKPPGPVAAGVKPQGAVKKNRGQSTDKGVKLPDNPF